MLTAGTLGLTRLEMPPQSVAVAATRHCDALRGGLDHPQNPARRPQGQQVVVVGVAVADELVPG